VKRPVTELLAASLATASGVLPVAVATGPGLTVLIRTPWGPASLDSALQKLASAALAAL
jgi:hypothetical protein